MRGKNVERVFKSAKKIYFKALFKMIFDLKAIKEILMECISDHSKMGLDLVLVFSNGIMEKFLRGTGLEE